VPQKHGHDEEDWAAIQDLEGLLMHFPSCKISVWELSGAIERARQLKGSNRRTACMMIARALVRARVFLEIGSALVAELLNERADVSAVELSAQYLEAVGDHRRAKATRRLKDVALDSPTDDELLEAELGRLFTFLHGSESSNPLPPMERYARESEALARLAPKRKGRGKKRR
jgi:hypothetical protein